jgi:hypothetical protein
LLLCLFPSCSYFLSLALTPSAMIGLDANMRAPKVELLCSCKPSTYAYPPPVTTGEGRGQRATVLVMWDVEKWLTTPLCSTPSSTLSSTLSSALSRRYDIKTCRTHISHDHLLRPSVLHQPRHTPHPPLSPPSCHPDPTWRMILTQKHPVSPPP